MDEMKIGAKLKDIYKTVTQSILEKRSDLVDKLSSNFGSAVTIFLKQIGLDLKDKHNVINGNSEAKVADNQSYFVAIGVKDVPTAKNKKFTVMMGETLLIEKRNTKFLTEKIKRGWNNMFLEFEEEEEEEEEKSRTNKSNRVSKGGRNSNPHDQNAKNQNFSKLDIETPILTRHQLKKLMNPEIQPALNEKDRARIAEHQQELLRQKTIELKERVNTGGFGNSDSNEYSGLLTIDRG